jgi:hypothetical protein
MRVFFLVLLIVLFESCFLFRDHKRRPFSYTDASGTTATVATIVPKGFKRQEVIKDSLGQQGVVYHYLNGARFYVLYSPLGGNFQKFDTAIHIPKPHLQGGIFYKGIDSTERWWREAQPPFFRIGYLNVNSDNEVAFDSAVNYLKPGVSSFRRRK